MACCGDDPQNVRPQAAAFAAVRAESIDFAVLERHDKLAVVPFAGVWSDIGSWNALAALTPADDEGNRIEGNGLAIQSKRTYIHAQNRTVVALGTQDLLVVDTPDAILVAASTHVEDVRHVVAALEGRQSPEAHVHRKVERPWGWYNSIDRGERFQVKRLMVKPGASLSMQKHFQRAEHWIVVSGTASVTKGAETFLLTERSGSGCLNNIPRFISGTRAG